MIVLDVVDLAPRAAPAAARKLCVGPRGNLTPPRHTQGACRTPLAARSVPCFPGCLARFPKRLEQTPVAQRVHALPEPVVPVGHQLAVAGESFHGFALPGGFVAVDVVEDLRLEHEERAVDPPLA